MRHGANTPSGEDRIRTKGTNPENEQDSVSSAAKSAAVDAQNPPPGPAAAVAHRCLADAEQGRPAADHAAGRLVATRPLSGWGLREEDL